MKRSLNIIEKRSYRWELEVPNHLIDASAQEVYEWACDNDLDDWRLPIYLQNELMIGDPYVTVRPSNQFIDQHETYSE